MKKLRLRETELRTPGHRVREWQSWVSKPYTSKTMFLPPFPEEGAGFTDAFASLPAPLLHLHTGKVTVPEQRTPAG